MIDYARELVAEDAVNAALASWARWRRGKPARLMVGRKVGDYRAASSALQRAGQIQ